MKKDRLYIDKDNEQVIEMLKKHDILGFNGSENKEIFTIAVALGHREPMDIEVKNTGFVRTEYIKTSDKAILSSALLGLAKDDNDLDKYSNEDDCFDYAEKCANHGIRILKENAEDASFDKELFERRIMKDLDKLYAVNVESNI